MNSYFILTLTTIGGCSIWLWSFLQNNDEWVKSIAFEYILLYNEKYVEYQDLFKKYYNEYEIVKQVADTLHLTYRIIYFVVSYIYYLVCFGELPLNEDCIYLEYCIQTYLDKYKNKSKNAFSAPFMFRIYDGIEIRNMPNYSQKKDAHISLYSNAFIREMDILQRELDEDQVDNYDNMTIISNIESAIFIIREQIEYNKMMNNNVECLGIFGMATGHTVIRVLRKGVLPNIPSSNEIIHCRPSRVKFLAIEYVHPELKKSVFLEMNTSHLVEGNELFSWCYIRREINKIPFFNRPPFDNKYTIKLIDGMANEITLTSIQYVKLSKFKYEIIG